MDMQSGDACVRVCLPPRNLILSNDALSFVSLLPFFFYFLLFIQWQIIFAALGTISDDGGWWMGTATTH